MKFFDFAPIVAAAFAEDLGERGDITSTAIALHNTAATGTVHAKDVGVFAGAEILPAIAAHFSPALTFELRKRDGERITRGDDLVVFRGNSNDLLIAERTILNFLSFTSGIATQVRDLVDLVAPYGAKILDTRKTLPGLRAVQKYAVRCGGGVNHRMGLYDEVMIKNNHVSAAGSLEEAIACVLRCHGSTYPIIVEARTLDEVAIAAAAPITRILLDNMSPETIGKAVAIVAGRVPTEASGNISHDTATSYAAAGVNYLSVGGLTKHVRSLDFSMRLQQ